MELQKPYPDVDSFRGMYSTGSSQPSVYDQIYANTPRGTLLPYTASPRTTPVAAHSPRSLARPHMEHHFGMGWDLPSKAYSAHTTSWQRHGDRSQQSEGLGASPHPFLRPSQRLHGCSLDAGLPDRLPPRASREPSNHPSIKPHEAHYLSWPGTGLHVPRNKHFFKPHVDSRNEARGELPPTAQVLISAGSRPGFPTCAHASPERAHCHGALNTDPVCRSHTRSLNHVKVHVIPFCSDGQSISDVTTCVRHKRVRYSAIGWSVIWQHDARATSVSEPSRLPSEVRGRGRV